MRSTIGRLGPGSVGPPRGGRGTRGGWRDRTDDEEFYIPCLGKAKTTERFLKLAQRWQYYYDVERPHFGAGMNGKSPLGKLRELGWDLPDEFAAFPVILLDEVAMIWAVEGGHDVLAYYITYPLGGRWRGFLGPKEARRARLSSASRQPH